MQLRKLAASALGALMTGATLAFPAAASLADYPAPFVQDGESNFSIVVGSDAAVADVASAIDVAVTLGGQPTVEKTAEAGGVAQYTMEGGKVLERVGNKLIMGEYVNNATEKLDGDDIDYLKEVTFENEDGDEIKAEGEIQLGDTGKVSYSDTEEDLDKPVTHLDTSGSTALYTLVWDPESFMVNKTASESIDMFGKTLTFSGNKDKLTPTKFTMYGASATETIGTGETKTIGGADVSIVGANANADPATATIEVGGERQTVEADNQYTVGGEQIYIEDIFITTIPEKTASVSVSVGSEEWVFEDGEPLEVGGDTVDGTSDITIDHGSGKINEVQIPVTLPGLEEDTNAQGYEDVTYIKQGEAFTEPVFGTMNFAFAGRNVPLDSENRKAISLENGGDDIKVTFNNAGGDTYSMDMIHTDASGDYIEIGVEDTTLHTTSGQNLAEDDYFMVKVGSNAPFYTHILQYKDYDQDDSECEIVDVATGKNVAEYDNEDCILDLEQEVNVTWGGSNLKTPDESSEVVYTENWMKMDFSQITATSTGSEDTSEPIMFEEDYNSELEDETTPLSFNVTVDRDSGDSEAQVTGLSSPITLLPKDISDEPDTGGTPFGTSIEYDDEDQQYVKMAVPNKEVNYKVFVGPEGSEVSKTAGGQVTYNQIMPITSSVAKLDTDISQPSAVPEDLILVGGPCVNMHVATLVQEGKLEGVDPNASTCAARWNEAPELQLVEDAFAEGQTALVVAGATREGTKTAAAKLQDIATLPDEMYLDVTA